MRDFNHTVNVLVNAFFKGDLQAGTCSACAVGNIVAESMGYTMGHRYKSGLTLNGQIFTRRFPVWENNDGVEIRTNWRSAFCSAAVEGHIVQILDPTAYLNSIRNDSNLHKEIDSTGYTFLELSRMEKAFESVYIDTVGYNNKKVTEQQRMEGELAGLMAVVDILAYIHGVDLSTTNNAKDRFKMPVDVKELVEVE